MRDNNISIKRKIEYESDDSTCISTSLRNLSRKCRKEILNSHMFHAFWLGGVNKNQYESMLYNHLHIWQHLESLLTSLNGTFEVRNLLEDGSKYFSVDKYVTENRKKSSESPRVDRRLTFLRELAHEKTTHLRPRSTRTRRAIGADQRARA